jgi:hypothetical protein
MTRQPDFSGVWVKLERAKEHINDLEARVQTFKQAKPYRAFRYCELDTGDLVFEVKASDQPPLWWSAILGDAIHNLRSSLDLLVCELVDAAGNSVKTTTGFPIMKDADAFASNSLRKVKGAPETAVELIKAAKPYKGGNDAFWRLHQLDITDKHKLLVPVGMANVTIIYDILRIIANNPDLVDELTTPQELSIPLDISTPEPRFPLEDGAELYRVPARDRDDPMTQMHMYPEFVFEVAFGEGEVVKGEPLFPTLHQLAQFVEDFVKRFLPLITQKNTP